MLLAKHGHVVENLHLKVKEPSVTISIDYSDSQVPFSVPFLLSGPGIPNGFAMGVRSWILTFDMKESKRIICRDR